MNDLKYAQDHLAKLTSRVDDLTAQLATLNAQLADEHPHRCTACGGWGGSVGVSGDGWNEPREYVFDECEACLSQSLNPLDLNLKLTDDEVEAHVDAIMDEAHPILSKITELEVVIDGATWELDMAKDELAGLEASM